MVASLTPLFDPDVLTAAFGPPGQAGDPVRIRQLAERWTNVYELLLDWTRRLRSADPSNTYRPLFESLAQLADRPVREYHDFVDGFVANVDRIPDALASGDPLNISMTLTLTIDDAAQRAFSAELNELQRRLLGSPRA